MGVYHPMDAVDLPQLGLAGRYWFEFISYSINREVKTMTFQMLRNQLLRPYIVLRCLIRLFTMARNYHRSCSLLFKELYYDKETKSSRS